MSKPNLITSHDVDRLGEIRQQMKILQRNADAICGVILRSGRQQAEGRTHRVLVVERTVPFIDMAQARSWAPLRWVLDAFKSERTHIEIRTFPIKHDN